MTNRTDRLYVPEDPAAFRNLRIWNVAVGVVHLVQAAAILVLSNGFSIPILVAFQDGPPGTPPGTPDEAFSLAIGPAVALFLALAAIDHLLVASPGIVGWYERNLRRTINYARWIEYSISASIMIVLIAVLPGITNLYALIGIFAVNATMILFGLIMERVNRDAEKVDWLPFWFGSLAGAVPWVIIVIALIGAEAGDGMVPGFVYGIFVSLFLFFNSFAVNMALQYKGVGKWRNYLFGEKAYIVLSLGAKSALAWQVFSGTLAS